MQNTYLINYKYIIIFSKMIALLTVMEVGVRKKFRIIWIDRYFIDPGGN